MGRTCVGDTRNAFKILVRKHEEKRPFGDMSTVRVVIPC
jgi:hypothetical protein